MSDTQKLLPSEVGQAELDLIEAVAKSVDPGAWDDRPVLKQSIASASGYEIDPSGTAASRAVNDRNRLRAREIAIDVIEIVRRSTPPGDKTLREALEQSQSAIADALEAAVCQGVTVNWLGLQAALLLAHERNEAALDRAVLPRAPEEPD